MGLLSIIVVVFEMDTWSESFRFCEVEDVLREREKEGCERAIFDLGGL